MLRSALLLGLVLACLSLPSRTAEAIPLVTVNTALDGDNGACTAEPGGCTLREAINAANASPDFTEIRFNIPATNPHTILLTSLLPAITEDADINGGSQPGFAVKTGNKVIMIDGQNARSTCLRATNGALVFITHLAVGRCTSAGIVSESAAVGIFNNYIGTDHTGLIDMGNGEGIVITGDGDANIDENVISGNDVRAVRLTDVTSPEFGSFVTQNFIGTDRYGLKALPNGAGILMDGSSPFGWVNVLSNVISGNLGVAVQLNTGSLNAVVDNLIGTDITGTRLVSNGGGVGVLAGDVGVFGTGAPKQLCGRWRCNVIAGAGVNFSSSNNHVSNSIIGADATGSVSLGSPVEGVFISGSSNSVGSVLIANSSGDAIRVAAGADNTFGDNLDLNNNFVSGNGGLGIDLDPDGVNPVDPGDGDSGPNGLLNRPTIGSVTIGATTLTVDGTLDNGAGLFDIWFFGSASCDGSGYGEGGQFAGSIGASSGPFSGVIPRYGAITALVTDASGSTSEYSNCVTASCPLTDTDCDQYIGNPPNGHRGPQNTMATQDNCANTWNPWQQNADGNFYRHRMFPNEAIPGFFLPYNVDDLTWPMSDASGDACDSDDDNDGLTDAQELSGSACGGVITSSLVLDSDFDRFRDGVECFLGTDPLSPLTKPDISLCGPSGDTDGDRLSDRVESCFYNSNPNSVDSDGDQGLDGGKDGCEAASVNNDRVVNAGDQLLLGQELSRSLNGAYFSVGIGPLASMDINKDGIINAGDQLLMGFFISPPGQCP
jgi:CSLREA domain-containing protein